MIPVPINPFDLIPDAIRKQILDSAVDFMAEQVQKLLGEQVAGAIKGLRSTASFKDAFRNEN